MLKKIKNLLLDMLYSQSGSALLTFCIMLLLCIFGFLNKAIFLSSNLALLPILLICFGAPFFIFWISRGGKKYIPSAHLELPKRMHFPTIILSAAFLMLGNALIKILIFDYKYTEFDLYNMFFAHRDGNLFNDLYLVLAFCIVPPIFEAIIFRAVTIKEHSKRSRLVCTLFSSLLYSLLGFSFDQILPRFFTGVMLCIVLFATESIATTVAIHIAYNFFAVFVEPTIVSIKSVSASYELFTFILAILTFAICTLLLSHLSRLYKKYSKSRFGESFVKSTPRERAFWQFAELATSIPALACYVLFLIISMILQV